MQAPELIERAAKVTGSEYALAQALGVKQTVISDAKHGRGSLPVDLRAVMASIAGLDPMAELLEGIEQRLSDDRKSRLRQAIRDRIST